MATVINNPPGSGESAGGGGAGLVVGVIVAIILVVLFFVYALPALRPVPGNQGDGGTTIQIPDKLDVNVNAPETK